MWLQNKVFAAALLGAGALLAAGSAQAGTCAAATPEVGAEIRGPVLHVIDGETLCIARDFTPDSWIAVRLAPEAHARVSNAPAPSKSALMAAAFGKDAVCRIEAVEDGQAIARCEVEGHSVGEAVRRPAALKAAANWR